MKMVYVVREYLASSSGSVSELQRSEAPELLPPNVPGLSWWSALWFVSSAGLLQSQVQAVPCAPAVQVSSPAWDLSSAAARPVLI